MSFALLKSRRQLAIFLITILLVIAFSFQDFVPFGSKSAHELNTARTVPDTTRQDAGRIIVRNGSDNLNQSSSLIEGPDGEAHSHGKRAPETLSYDQAVCKGVRNLKAIQQGNPNPPRFTQHDFDDGGWSLVSDFPRVIPDELKTPVEKLGIPSNPAGLHRIAAQQYSDFTTMNGERSDLRDHVPKLNRWSDVVWFIWAKQAGNQAGNLRYIFRDNITNDDTRGVIDQIFGIPSKSLDLPWPGKTFDVEKTKEGKGLLGTPHGAGIAWMLADHKAELGNRALKITVFTSDKNYYMLFELTRT
ncbi:MAG: hypothetical protein Q9225_002012 [Loekoesia sp. 1 TL-2023]